MKTLPELLGLCVGNLQVTDLFSEKGTNNAEFWLAFVVWTNGLLVGEMRHRQADLTSL